MSRSRLIIIGAVGLIVIFFVLLFTGIIPGLQKSDPAQQVIKLNFWGVFDEPRIMVEVTKTIPGYQVTYRKFDVETYESELINALAAGRGPDVFMVHSSWLPKHTDKLTPISYPELRVGRLRDVFPAVVEQDFAPDGDLVYALPLYIDTLAMFYNQNIFDAKGVALPPQNWEEFQNLIPRLRELDSTRKIVKAAAAIGGSNRNVDRATDLLNTFMLQAGVPMVADDFSRASFAAAGIEPLLFYTRFANPASEFYTWSPTFKNSLDAFAEESAAVIFNYAYQIPLLKEKNPFLEIGVAPLPQPKEAKTPVNFANYWGVAVSNKFVNRLGAWNFIWYLTINERTAKLYGEKTHHPPALRSLISQKLNDPQVGIFARQALSARSWPQIDNSLVEQVLSKAIEDVLAGRSANQALKEAEDAITKLMKEKKGRL